MLKYLGIDWGEKRIGLALGDDETKIASPFKIVGSINDVVTIIAEEKINVVVLGLPLSIANYKLPTPFVFNEFKKTLQSKLKVPLKLIDERLSSKAADSMLGKKKEKAERDAVAAMLILQSYFDTFDNNL